MLHRLGGIINSDIGYYIRYCRGLTLPAWYQIFGSGGLTVKKLAINKRLNGLIKILSLVVLYLFSAFLTDIFLGRPVFFVFSDEWVMLLSSAAIFFLLALAFKSHRISIQSVGIFEALCVAVIAAVVFFYQLIYRVLSGSDDFSWTVLNALLLLDFLEVYIFHGRILRSARRYFKRHAKERVMIIGAGIAGASLIREMRTSDKINMAPVCIIDDSPEKQKMLIDGVEVVGTREDIPAMADKYKVDIIAIAIPSAGRKDIMSINSICVSTKRKVLILPGMYQFMNGSVSVSNLKKVSIQDLLGREQITVNLDEIMGYIDGHVILVTGGGGSIGSELCRQIVTHNPAQLIILDIYENNAYDIEQELRAHYPNAKIKVLIASVRDADRINQIFEEYRPDVVFNAAAHKHVPLMENSPCEAVKNNVFGTLNTARAADRYGTKKFIQISTDKAVNPTNIMGATKRICEMIVQTLGRRSKTEFVAVRFGNVLGSNGSVIPLFKRQISEGGPVTVTHPDIIRYFMTIPEAVLLVLQAGAYAGSGEIYVLDMGEPMKIYDLALNMIRLSGLEPDKDIKIVFTGLRPGEKLYEERLMSEEGLKTTANGKISVAMPIELDEDVFWESLENLRTVAESNSPEIKHAVAGIVKTYKPKGEGETY